MTVDMAIWSRVLDPYTVKIRHSRSLGGSFKQKVNASIKKAHMTQTSLGGGGREVILEQYLKP